MCYKVDSSFVLIHLLKTKGSCSIKELVAIKDKIEKNITSVYVDITRNSILETISFYPEIFTWEDNQVKKKETAKVYFQDNLIGFFSKTNKEIEEAIIKCIEGR